MKLLVAGGGGMLGTAIVSAARESGHQVTTLGRAHLNVERFQSIVETVREHSPQILINCAAHTDVEGAENDAAGILSLESACSRKYCCHFLAFYMPLFIFQARAVMATPEPHPTTIFSR